MNDETLTKLSEVLCNAFHNQEWEAGFEGSDQNRIAWKNCVMTVIKAYERDKWSQVGFGRSIKGNLN